MKKSIFLLAVLSLALNINVHSQGRYDSNDTLSYELLQNDPTMSFASLYIHLLSASLETYNFALTTGVGVKGMYKQFFVDASFELDYVDGLGEISWSDSERGFSVYKPKKSRNANILFGYAFKQEELTDDDMGVTLKGSGNVRYYTTVPGVYRKDMLAEIGFTKGFTWYNLNNMEIEARDLSTGNSETVTISGNSSSTVLDYGFLALGGSIAKFHNITINAEKFGKKSSRSYVRYYAHLLISVKKQADDIYLLDENSLVSYDEIYRRYSINDGVKSLPIGLRIGYQANSLKTAWFGQKIEAGWFPGLSGNLISNLYLSYHTNFSLSAMFRTR